MKKTKCFTEDSSGSGEHDQIVISKLAGCGGDILRTRNVINIDIMVDVLHPKGIPFNPCMFHLIYE